MNQSQVYKVVIEGQKSSYTSDPEFEPLMSFMEEMNWVNDIETYQFEIHSEPTYEMIKNQFSFNERRDMTGEYPISYDKFLTEAQIQSLNYWEYLEEKIYGLVIYGRWDDMWDSARAKDVSTVTEGLLAYLNEHELISFHEETVEELRKLNAVAKFADKYEFELKFFNPNV